MVSSPSTVFQFSTGLIIQITSMLDYTCTNRIQHALDRTMVGLWSHWTKFICTTTHNWTICQIFNLLNKQANNPDLTKKWWDIIFIWTWHVRWSKCNNLWFTYNLIISCKVKITLDAFLNPFTFVVTKEWILLASWRWPN